MFLRLYKCADIDCLFHLMKSMSYSLKMNIIYVFVFLLGVYYIHNYPSKRYYFDLCHLGLHIFCEVIKIVIR